MVSLHAQAAEQKVNYLAKLSSKQESTLVKS